MKALPFMKGGETTKSLPLADAKFCKRAAALRHMYVLCSHVAVDEMLLGVAGWYGQARD